MKNNVILKPALIALSLGVLAILAIIIAAVFFGIPYNAFYLLHNLENIAEIVLLLSITIVAFAFLIYFIKNVYDKNNYDKNNKYENKENNDENIKTINKNEKSKKVLIIALSVFALLLAAALFIFSGRFFGVYYILHNLEDIFEGIFKLAFTAAALVFLAVFFKKVWNKI
ncbi:hypothetical protein Q5M87_06470 [Brachyspira innocens]|uniref:Uncharacterized protein n=1 Tax=Brachyspira innocens TaxID=13264 RepID=A0ABT8YUX7_9SPIR|nr:hypothetical protein [Brachyspira innocens]MDO6993652.1 hypothetical protein [Brachyspira innocens]MDO7019702.1 hypothetical protein [Brachyspira innocens]